VVRPGGLELPTFWFVAIRVKMLNALFGVAYGLETPFFPQLVAPNVAPKTELCRTCSEQLHEFNPKSRVRPCRYSEPPSTGPTSLSPFGPVGGYRLALVSVRLTQPLLCVSGFQESRFQVLLVLARHRSKSAGRAPALGVVPGRMVGLGVGHRHLALRAETQQAGGRQHWQCSRIHCLVKN
jgi:hypothetical protein